MRITIVGLPGSGKSYLGRAIEEKLHISHIHIDRFWFEAGGRTGSHDTPNIDQVRAHVREKVLAAISETSWVSDGIYSKVQPDIANKADVMIFLDIPLWKRLGNHMQRLINLSGRHRELGLWDDVKFFVEIIKRNFINKPKLTRILKQYRNKLITLHSRKEIEQYLKNLD